MENLDLRCAELGKRLAEIQGAPPKQAPIAEPVINDALAVLEEQGVYAFFLYLKARRKEEESKVSQACQTFLQQTPTGGPLLGNADVWEGLRDLATNLDNLFFARDLLRQALIYGRYHIKARDTAKGRT